jgi:hypothetical protein
MKIQRSSRTGSCFAVGTVSLLALSACGGGSGSGGTTYTLTSGSYRLSGVSATPPDNCNLGSDLNGVTFPISVSGNNATFVLGQSPDPNRDPVMTIQGNTLNPGSKTIDENHNEDDIPFDCVETVTATISGLLTAQDQVQGTFVLSSTRRSGTQCTTANLGYKTFPCTSTVIFTARKI